MKKNKETITVSIHMKVEGRLEKISEVSYERGRETCIFTLDDLARLMFMWERRFGSGSTYLMDGFLQDAEKKLDKKDGETAQSVFEKYWINWNKTINEDFEARNKGEKGKYTLWKEENDYLSYEINKLCRHLNEAPLPVKYGLLHWFHQDVMHGDVNEYLADVDNIPDYIKQIVEEKIIKK